MATVMPNPFNRVIAQVFSRDEGLRARNEHLARLEQYQAMQHAITRIIARSTELDTAIPRIIQAICETADWDLGEVWYIDRDANALSCTANWTKPTLSFPLFAQSSMEITFAPGKGLPGRVWMTGKPGWMNNIVNDSQFMRGAIAQHDGLHAGLGIPIRTDGEVIGVLTLFSRQVRATDNELLRVLDTIGSQIGLFIERKRIEQVEREQARRLAILEERQRLGRDLHDSVTQTLFSASVIAEMLPRLQNPDKVRSGLDELHHLTRSALTEMRSLLVELRPSTHTETELSELLRQLADNLHARSGLIITLDLDCCPALHPDVQLALYRITQEAFNNIIKHAGATHILLRLCNDPEQIELCIRDNGRGFDKTQLPPNHFGLGIMRERAEAIGAQFCLESVPGSGTSLTVNLAVS